MEHVDPKQPFLPSLLDRLLPANGEGNSGRFGYTVAQMIDSVRRDLENLLNTRRTVEDWPSDFVEVSNSILAYGMPDLTAFNAGAPREREELALLIGDALTRFEPRLRDVRVSLVEVGTAKTPKAHFHIEARLRMEPALTVNFETILDVPAGHAAVLPSET
ncbi:MAG TPA: type VI secretion system baseplate subunit TssE [Gemmataceae bacterium]|nr:type VI secretion system baseplate subunit TssE [Gemmataceae bacterium]